MKSPLTNIKELTLRLSVKINGGPLNDIYSIVSVNVAHEIYKISHAEIVLVGDAIESADTPTSDSADFDPGNTIEIIAGIGSDPDTTIFKGMIVKQGIEIGPTALSRIKLHCKHKAVSMTFNRKAAEFDSKSDGDAITNIINSYSGITGDVAATTLQYEKSFQKMASDWDFIVSRAEFNGHIVILDGDNVTICEPKLSGSPVLRVAMGESIISFKAELNAEKQAPEIQASAWNIKDQTLTKESASEPTLNEHGSITGKKLSASLNQQTLNLYSGTAMIQSDIKTWANAHLLRMRMNAIKGQVTYFGNATVKAGDLIQLQGVGEKFSGNAFVSGVAHTIEGGKWNTRAKFGLDAKFMYENNNFSDTPAAGQLPAAHGLQVATVKKISKDPDSQYRILVTIPSNANNPTGFWARICSFHATADAGAFFLPEVNDEVILGFLDSDPRFPVILGSLYSVAKKAPIEVADENNYMKAFVTKSKLKISFDDEKKILTITTPAGNTISLDDDGKAIAIKDQNNNEIKLSSNGIDISTNNDLNIKATNVNISTKAKTAIAAQADVTIEGMNINQTAKVGLTAKGNATAEVSASGQTTIKGGMVMIN